MLIVLCEQELLLVSSNDLKVTKRVAIKSFTDRILGLTGNNLLLVVDKMEGLLVYDLTDMTTPKIVSLPSITSTSCLIKKYNNEQNPLTSYYL